MTSERSATAQPPAPAGSLPMSRNPQAAALVNAPDVAATLEAALRRVLVGQPGAVRGVLIALLGGGHVLLEGVPGLGKTLLVRTLAALLALSSGRLPFTPDLMPADIMGTQVIGGPGRSFEFQPGPVFANLLLADEINRATPQHAIRPARSDAGAHGDRGGTLAAAASAILRARHGERGGWRRPVRPARSAA